MCELQLFAYLSETGRGNPRKGGGRKRKENTIKSLVWAVSFELISSLISAALLVLSSLSWMCNVKLEVEMFDNLLFFPPSADQEAVLGVV